MRRLTPIASPVGGGEALLVAFEDSAPRIVRVDPRDGSEATELDLADFLQQRKRNQVPCELASSTVPARGAFPPRRNSMSLLRQRTASLSPPTARENRRNKRFARRRHLGWARDFGASVNAPTEHTSR